MKLLSFFVFFLAIQAPAIAATAFKCSCVGAKGNVICGPRDFAGELDQDPDGYNVSGEDPVGEAERFCRIVHPDSQELRCACTSN